MKCVHRDGGCVGLQGLVQTGLSISTHLPCLDLLFLPSALEGKDGTAAIFYFNACTVHLLFLYNDQNRKHYFTNYHTPTCVDTIVSSSGSW